MERLESRHLLDARLVISELVANNTEGLDDEDGDHPDWLEIYNAGDRPADMSGWYLTDNPTDLGQWRFPTGTSLSPDQYLIVFASGKDRVDPAEYLHTSFRLNAEGEYLALVQPDQSTVAFDYAPKYPPQRPNTSYGIPSAAMNSQLDETGFFDPPTPAARNAQEVDFQGIVDISVSAPRGFYQQPLDVVISSDTQGATIVYTTDGSMPSWENGILVAPPDADATPIAFLNISTTTTLRAAAFKDDFWPSQVSTHTYLFLDDVLAQSPDGTAPAGWPTGPVNDQMLDYGMDPDVVHDPLFGHLLVHAFLDIPSISIVTDRDHLFDPESGIYVNGIASRQDGRAWERPASIELIHPDGEQGFQIDAGLRLRGGQSRSGTNPKHAFRLFFRGEYGTEKLQYPMFGDEGVDKFDNLDLRTAQSPSWSWCVAGVSATRGGCQFNTMLRDVFARDTQGAMGMPYTRSRYYHLYLNGQYWGLYQSEERPEASYAESYFGGDKEDYDVIKVESFPHHIEATDGNLDAWRELWEAAKAGFESNETYLRVQGLNPDGTRNSGYPVLLDVDHLIDYMLVVLYTGNLDGPIANFGFRGTANNWFGIRDRNGEEGFRFFIHDAEWTLLNVKESRLGPWRAGHTFEQSNPQWLHQQLMANQEYRLRFADRAQIHLFNGGALTPAAALERLQSRAEQIDPAIVAESARWGDAHRAVPYTRDDWLNALSFIVDEFFPGRTEKLLAQLNGENAILDRGPLTRRPPIRAPLYPDVGAPTLSQHGGEVPSGFQLSMSAATDIYFTLDGSDPRNGAATMEVQSLVDEDSLARVLVPSDDSADGRWTARAFDDSGWTLGTAAVGYETGSDFESLIGFDSELQMYGVNPTAYIRLPFYVESPAELDTLELHIQYDGGFIAYLNGNEVARRFAPVTPAWNSRSTGTNQDDGAVHFEPIDISASLELLHRGNNVLAIHGMNYHKNSHNFLMVPRLRAGTITDAGALPTAFRYTEPITLSRNTVVNARSLSGIQWSALSIASFSIQPPPLRITELMYHPAEPTLAERMAGFDDDVDFEFIELVNSDSTTIDLEGVRLTEGVEFTFSSMSLGPGEHVVVVRNRAAFSQRYGTGVTIAGQYGNPRNEFKLNNGGETIRLEDSSGSTIQELTYDDSWYPRTDGSGHSLEIVDVAHRDLDSWSNRASWQPSIVMGGSPGSKRDHPAKPGDANRDGVFDQADIVQVLRGGKFGGREPADWSRGDWNGDGVFDELDIVRALQLGNYIRNRHSRGFGESVGDPLP